ncbi:hypothetical protein D3C78_1195130 [compost metagenome]
MTGHFESFADRLDATVHHVRWGHDLSAGFSVGQGLPDQCVDGDVVLHVAFFIKNAVLAVGGERIQGHVGDHAQLRELRTQRAGGALGDALRVPGLFSIQRLEFRRRHREQRQRRDPQFDPLGRLFQQQVDGQAFDARHRSHRFATVFTVKNEHRQDQVIDGQDVFTDQTTREVVTTIAAQAGCREQTVGGGKAHGRLLSPRLRASVTVISGHYDERITVVCTPVTGSRIPLSL